MYTLTPDKDSFFNNVPMSWPIWADRCEVIGAIFGSTILTNFIPVYL